MNNSFRAVLYFLVGFAALAARAVTFTSDTTIDFANTNYDGGEVIISNCVVTIDGPHAFASLQVLGGGKLTHTGSDTGLLYSQFSTNEQPVLTSTNPVALATTNIVLSSVVVTDLTGTTNYTNGVDYSLVVSQGVTSIQRTDPSAIPDGGSVSVTYSAVVTLGPSGLNLSIAGDALIEAGSAIALNGLGYTNGYGPGHGYVGGMSGSPAGSGGGHGGVGGISGTAVPGGAAYDSVLQPTDKGSGGAAVAPSPGVAGGGAAQLSVGGVLRINGTLSANGASALSERAGGGAGGSFWLTAQTFAGSGSVSVDGGDGESPAGGGGAGGRIAIYYQINTFTGVLSARGGRGAQNGGAGTIYTKVGPAVGSALMDNAGRSGATTPLLTTEAFALTVKNGAMMSVANAQTLSSLVLVSNGWATMSGASGTLTVTGDVTIPAGCGINVDGLGYPSASGPGAGGTYTSSGYAIGGGAGYGGYGAQVAPDSYSSRAYGSYAQPVDRGSGGGYSQGGAGGGRVYLVVKGTLTLDGKISANGSAGAGQDSGGGSGGSIWLDLGTFAGAGALSANGGAGNDLGGGGAGGRIAVYYASSSFAGSIKAIGAGSGTKVGGAGTIYTKMAGQPAGQLLLDNGGLTASASSPVTATEPLALTVQGGAIAAPVTQVALGSMLINSNGWVRLTNSPLNIIGDVIVQAGGGIVADGNGYAANTGPGAGHYYPISGGSGGSSGYYGVGGGFGGIGGFGSTSAGGMPYDYVTSPGAMGSGGGCYGVTTGGAGGGAIRLMVGGTLSVNGRISAEGTSPAVLNAGGGSGGSINLTVGSLAGSGLISANGAAGNAQGGGGAGGRIAVTYTNTSYFSGTMRAWGGGGGAWGAAGTIYTKGGSQSAGQLVLDNAGASGTSSDIMSAGTVDLTIRGGAILSNYTSLPPINNLLIASNSWLILNKPTPFTLTINGNATLQAGGGIKGDGAGYGPGNGPGSGHNAYSSPTGYGYVGSGGGYGGCGGAASAIIGGGANGSALSNPVLGSGGGYGTGSPQTLWSAGGGSLTLRVTGILVLDGRLSVDGMPGAPGSNGGGGSGGSIYITTAALMGAGSLSACGGAGDGLGGGGGGGRIFLYPTVNAFTGSAVAYGGNGYARGGAGTVYTAVGQSLGQIVTDNGGVPGTNTLLSDSGSFDLVVRGGAVLTPTYYSTLALGNLSVGSNSWIVFPTNNPSPLSVTLAISGNADIDAGGGIKADGAGYPAGAGNGAGRTYYLSPTYAGSGGGFGGAGGVGGLTTAPGGMAYGSAIGTPQPGSGGGNAPTTGSGGAGGAALSLRVTGTLNVDGKISANGIPGQSSNGGGGSGGSVYITAGLLLGSGTISANGGNGLGLGGGGGGGRIILLPNASSFSGQATAYGGGGYGRGGAGTVYTLVGSSRTNPGFLLVDNGGVLGTNTPLSDAGNFDLSLRGGAKGVITSSAFTIRNLSVAANGWLTPPTPPLALNITGSGVVEAGGGIIADGLGYAAASGPGAGITSSDGSRGGGGYGGFGGGNSRGGGAAYGSVAQPNQFGSGGAAYYVGSASPTNAGAGGGAVLLNVAGTLDVEGRISANGNSSGTGDGGGAGGSVWLTVGTLLGTGSIAANGGNGSGSGGGGGGGRIALVCGTNLFSGTTTAYGGTGSSGNGGAGTIYTALKNGQSATQVIVDNGGLPGTNTSITAVTSSTDLVIRNGAVVSASGNPAFHNLLVLSNGWLRFGSTYAPVLVSGNATIQAGGGITADGAGFAAAQGNGAGRTLTSAWGTAGGGGAYGGNGASSASGGAGGAGYGSPTAATNPGSGGGSGPDSAFGGAGGGVVALTVTGTLQLDGRISANGAPGLAPGGGGGSGGSVSLSAGLLAGAGLVSANGGTGDGMGGGGGGGRIVLQYNTKTFTGAVTAFGGTGTAPGGAGTIYTSPLNHSTSVVLVDNGGQVGTNTPLLASGDYDLTIQNGAIASASGQYLRWNKLLINAGGTLTAPPSRTNLELMVLGDASIQPGGALSLDGKGFAQALGPGAGLSSDSIGSGAGYGGVGGASSAVPGGPAYGSAQQPVDPGSGGGNGWGSPGPGSEGGGALRLSVAGTLTVNGLLSANGNDAVQEDGGGGSGGSLWIEAKSLAGNGTISADGGQGEFFGGGGGAGGRIALYAGNNAFAGQLSAAGAPGYAWGQDGSIYTSAAFGAPFVLSQTPAGIVSNSVASVDLFFSTPLDPDACLGNNQSVLAGPDGTQSSMLVAAMPGSTHLQLSFPPQTAPGTYTFTVGPGIVSLYGLPMSQVYTGSFVISVPVIQGTVTDLNGQPLPGVVLQSSTSFAMATTDTNGNYALSVEPGSSVTVTPASGSLVFVPKAQVYTNVTANLSNQNYLAVTSIVPTLAAQCSPTNLTMSWFGIPGVSYQALCSTNLVDWMPYGEVVVGTNGMVQLSMPTDADPVKFFRLRASN